jgi:hypothetical protein
MNPENININIKHVKTRNHNIDNDFTTSLFNKVSANINIKNKLEKNKLEKIDGDLNIVLKFNDYNNLLKYNYNIKQLKQISKDYKLKITGNKQALVLRIYSFLYLSKLTTIIQKMARGLLQRKYNSIQGPGLRNRLLCTNTIDFLSMDELTTIPNEQFFSFKDEDGFIYGFDILSLYNLIYKCNGIVKNPFNTKPLSSKVIETIMSFIRLSKVLNITLLTELSDVTKELSITKSVELRTLALFQHIDSLGNYSDPQWFLSLNKPELIKFIRELIDIWHYRAPLTIETKRAICPPHGSPFNRFPHLNILQTIENINDIRNIILDVLEKLTNTGIDKDSKCLGAYYILGSITLVNINAATSLPWLYQAVCYI